MLLLGGGESQPRVGIDQARQRIALRDLLTFEPIDAAAFAILLDKAKGGDPIARLVS